MWMPSPFTDSIGAQLKYSWDQACGFNQPIHFYKNFSLSWTFLSSGDFSTFEKMVLKILYLEFFFFFSKIKLKITGQIFLSVSTTKPKRKVLFGN